MYLIKNIDDEFTLSRKKIDRVVCFSNCYYFVISCYNVLFCDIYRSNIILWIENETWLYHTV